MDGQFISTDIRYRELMNNRRRSTSYRKVKSPGGGGGRSKSVDASFVGGAIGRISEEVGGMGGDGAIGGGESNLVDEVFEPIQSSGGVTDVIDVPIGGAVPKVVEEVVSDNDIGPKVGGVEGKVEEIVGVKDGDREDVVEGAVGGVEVPDDINVDVEKVDVGAAGGLEVPVVEDANGGAKESISNVLEEGEIGMSVESERGGGEDVYGMGGFEEFGSRGAEGGVGGADVGGGAESVVEPVHHIPRWKLYEILAHAEGECIMSVV